MLLFYIDESGTGLSNEQTPFFALAALAIPLECWQALDQEVIALKRRLVSWAKPEDFEIKGRDIRRGDKFFRNLDWPTRLGIMHEIAELINLLPCQIFAVQVDKRDLPAYIGSDNDLYRLAFWRLLEELENELATRDQPGMLLLDMRSDMHNSVQDRRLIDVYREWIESRQRRTHLVEVPWFGYSAFYAGLQLVDFAAYSLDFWSNEVRGQRNSELAEATSSLCCRFHMVRIP